MMLHAIAKRILGTSNERKLKSVTSLVAKINELEPKFRSSTDSELRQNTATFKRRLKNGEPLDAFIPEAFANCREAALRVLGIRAFDVQLIGGAFLHRQNIVEMQTGEGKTLVATFPAYLNALNEKGVHIVTANEYLAKRDAEVMGKVYASLGISVGVVHSEQRESAKRAAYAADVTYSTYSEFGFDYLRDNMKASLKDMVQRGHFYAIVDEADSIMIDEGRTPLVIAGPSTDIGALYQKIDSVVSGLEPHHIEIDDSFRQTNFTEAGQLHIELMLLQDGLLGPDKNLFDRENTSLFNHLYQSLRAHQLYFRDRHYVVHDGSVILIDESTGRAMPSRRLEDGLHQAIEAKEGVEVKAESTVLSSMSCQNYFRLYEKLSGMTGTAATDADEFMTTYKLDVVQIPPNVPSQRRDEATRSYRTTEDKLEAIVDTIRKAHERGQPVLAGTTSIEKSELFSSRLAAAGIPHNVLNANHHEKEAAIIANAGRFGAVTIATNMAGRGTDIQLGGVAETKDDLLTERARVVEAGGLLVLGTEHHDSQRIDNQLRGRAGRQGDLGHTIFFVSLEDDLLRNFEQDKVGDSAVDGPIEKTATSEALHLSDKVRKAQRRAQNRSFEARKRLLEFDDAVSEQRKSIFGMRRTILQSTDLTSMFSELRHQVIDRAVDLQVPEHNYASEWSADELGAICREQLGLDLPIKDWWMEPDMSRDILKSRIMAESDIRSSEKFDRFGLETVNNFGKQLLLKTVDSNWRYHVWDLEQLKAAVGLRVYASRTPLLEFKLESFAMFQDLLQRIGQEFTARFAQMQPLSEQSQTQFLARLLARKRDGDAA